MRISKLVGPRVLVRRLAGVEQTKTGLFLPPSAQERPQIGRVVAVGSYWPKWRLGTLERRPLPVAVGDLVMFPKFHDLTVWIDGEELLELRHNELLLKIEEDENDRSTRMAQDS